MNASALRLIAVLLVIGLLQTYRFLSQHHAHPVTFAALGGSLVLAAIFGVLRARTVRVWLDDGQAWSQGNWLTAVLWIASLAAHLGYDILVGHGTASGALESPPSFCIWRSAWASSGSGGGNVPTGCSSPDPQQRPSRATPANGHCAPVPGLKRPTAGPLATDRMRQAVARRMILVDEPMIDTTSPRVTPRSFPHQLGSILWRCGRMPDSDLGLPPDQLLPPCWPGPGGSMCSVIDIGAAAARF